MALLKTQIDPELLKKDQENKANSKEKAEGEGSPFKCLHTVINSVALFFKECCSITRYENTCMEGPQVSGESEIYFANAVVLYHFV